MLPGALVANGCGFAPPADRRGGDWFEGRRNHFVRQLLDDALELIRWFQQVQDLHSASRPRDHADGSGSGSQETRAELLRQCTAMVGTETRKGGLWQLKDLCHQIWPREEPGQPAYGVLLDWLVGSLFHEAVKLKENLYLLNNYGAAVVEGNTALLGDCCLRTFPPGLLASDLSVLVGGIAQQMERVGLLFGQVSRAIRAMLPELIGNALIVRLLAEREAVVTELWGESLEAIFSDVLSGGAAAGFCLAGESYLRGQWFRQALTMYERALGCDRQCNEARVRAAHLKAVLREDGAAV